MRKQPKRQKHPPLDDQQIADALLASGGILSGAALHLSERLGRCVGRHEVASRVETSPILAQARQLAEERRVEQAIAYLREAKGRRKVKQPPDAADSVPKLARFGMRGDTAFDEIAQTHEDAMQIAREDEEQTRRELEAVGLSYRTVFDDSGHDQRPRPWNLQAYRDKRLCMARTRQGFPCVRRVVASKNRCPSHGGKSTGPRTPAGREAIRQANRKRAAERRGG